MYMKNHQYNMLLCCYGKVERARERAGRFAESVGQNMFFTHFYPCNSIMLILLSAFKADMALNSSCSRANVKWTNHELPADVVCAHSLNKFKGLLEVHAHDRLFAYV